MSKGTTSALVRFASTAALALPLLLPTGCLFSRRKLPVPQAPLTVQTITPEELVSQLNKRWSALDTLTATVEIQFSVLKTREGVATDYTTLRGNILMRKPEMLRVLGRAPVIGTRFFDLASDGKKFTLLIPLKNKAIEGSNTVTKRSAKREENLRPSLFFDAMLVRGLDEDDFYFVTKDTDTIEDSAKKHLYSVPEYVLSITRHKPGSRKDTPVRVITFHREDLLPYQQDLYDSDGNLETQVNYGPYQVFDSAMYPSTITIKRPLEDYQIVLTVDKVSQNLSLEDNQFVVTIPDGTEIQKLD